MGIGNGDSSGDTYRMLIHLHISNFAIVPELELDFRPGFTAITGETGAGKSILVDALGLLLGDRADANWVSTGAQRAELSAEFSIAQNSDALDWLHQSDLSTGESCLLRRTIGSNGRSRAFINGSPVTLAQLQSLGQMLVEIHGQNEHLRLNQPAEQLRLVDGSGEHESALLAVKTAHTDWKRTRSEIAALEQDVSVSPAELEFLNFQLNELQQHDLAADSVTALHTTHDRLAAGDALQDAISNGIQQLERETSAGNTGINADLNTVLAQLEGFVSLDTDIGDACQMLREAAVNCAEATQSLQLARDRIDLDPDRFERTVAKLSQLSDLARKHQVPILELESVRTALTTRVQRAAGFEETRNQLESKLANHLDKYRKTAKILHQKRLVHSRNLSKQVSALMAELGMSGGVFELEVELNPDSEPSVHGDSTVQINISANSGTPPGPLQKIASGGELSRISLAIKAAATSGEAVIQIFDEVDAGIGGDTAISVGQLLKRLAAGNQVLCVTHLAQVAVCAQHQLQVRKTAEPDTTAVNTSLLNNTDRVDEIARMLSGRISTQSRAHAIELLTAAKPDGS